jgi:metal transporter CNNM
MLMDELDAVPLRKIPLNKVPFVPNNEPLLGILDKFQEGRSHMAIVSRFSVSKAASVKKAVKRGLTQRLRERVGMGDSSDDDDEEKGNKHEDGGGGDGGSADGETLKGDGNGPSEKDSTNDGEAKEKEKKDKKVSFRGRGRGMSKRRGQGGRGVPDLEAGVVDEEEKSKDVGGDATLKEVAKESKERPQHSRASSFVGGLPRASMSMGMAALEQSMPADAVLAKEDAEEVCAACIHERRGVDFFFVFAVLAEFRSGCYASWDYHVGGCSGRFVWFSSKER